MVDRNCCCLGGFDAGAIEKATAAKQNQLQELEREVVRDGGKLLIGSEYVMGLTIPSEFKEKWLSRLSDYTGLAQLSLANVAITDQEVDYVVRTCPTLATVDLSNTQITDQALTHLARLKSLYKVSLSGTRVSPEAIADLIAGSNELKLVDLENLQLTDDDLAQIHHPRIVSWNLAGNQLTDAGFKVLWEGTSQSLNVSRNPINGAVFSSPRTFPLNLTLDGVNIGDNEFAVALKQPFNAITLGKTRLTTKSLDPLLAICSYVWLLDGSFSETDLAQSTPVAVPQSLVVRDSRVTGDFLANWVALPMVLDLSNTLCGDDQLKKLALFNWTPHLISVNNCPITDACLPWIEKIAPQTVSIQGTQISANGLQRASFPSTVIILDYGQFTAEELQQLRAKKFQLNIRAPSGID
jgi:hypothetical protein